MNVDVRPSPATLPVDTAVPEIARVGVIGAGQMGNGIAHVTALAGVPVTLLDVKPEALSKALSTIGRN
ncbi:MAG: 3-hydroxybutyryl-CoA dehydrogenase, partial [Rhodospirillales bacterium]|nr:3-hydroxybutyryl-CoA dehydrogenase [Rhodospirillales bacterium]